MKAYLGLGSNVGDRLAHLQAAVNFIDLRAGKVLEISKVYETSPLYVTNQDHFYNAVICIETQMRPKELLECCKNIEREVGRVSREQYGPREIDIDLLMMFNDNNEPIIMNEEGLLLPHPRIHERMFVIEPLRDIAPELVPSQGLQKDILVKQQVKQLDAVLSIHRD